MLKTVYSRLIGKVEAYFKPLLQYMDRPENYRNPSPGMRPRVGPAYMPQMLNTDIKYFNRDMRRTTVLRKVFSPQSPVDNSQPFLSQEATNMVHKNPNMPPEIRNLSLAPHTGTPIWLYDSDEIVAKYKKLDVPPPFGKYVSGKDHSHLANKPVFRAQAGWD